MPETTAAPTAAPTTVSRSRDLLREELATRQRKNASYSLRSFARALGVSPSYLSLIFRGQRRLTPDKAQSIGRKLAWSQARRRYLSTLAEFESCVSPSEKQTLLTELNKLSQITKQVPSLDVDQFAMISEWHHSAILAILTLPRFQATTENISRRLNLQSMTCEAALSRLRRLKLVDQSESGRWFATNETMHVTSTPSEAIRLYHKEVLRKAVVAIDKQSFHERDFSNFVLTADPKTLPEAKKRIRQFQQEMAQLLDGVNPSGASAIYQLSIQLFRADHVDRPAKEKGKQNAT